MGPGREQLGTKKSWGAYSCTGKLVVPQTDTRGNKKYEFLKKEAKCLIFEQSMHKTNQMGN